MGIPAEELKDSIGAVRTMMKKYVFLTPTIASMGGAQMYIRNRALDLLGKGWAVDIITAQKGKVYIPDLRKYDLIIPELRFCSYLFSKKKRISIVDRLSKRIMDGEYDEIVIESTCLSESTWAEAIAQRCNARHFAYLLQEDNTLTSKIDQDFINFKFQRRELASITDQSVFDMFSNFSHIAMEESVGCHLPAYCNNVEEDIDSEWINIIKSRQFDYLVGCLSRLDKPFIMPALHQFIKYVCDHPDKRYLFVMIGGAPESGHFEKNIRKQFRNINNVELLITGYMFPISTRLLNIFDVFFTSAGSSWVCMRSGVPTISFDGNDYLPIGVLGRTTNHSLFRGEDEPPLDFNKLMDEILIQGSFECQEAHHELNKPDFNQHDSFLQSMSKERKYFSFDDIKLCAQEKRLSYSLFLIGPIGYTMLSDIKNSIDNCLSKQ